MWRTEKQVDEALDYHNKNQRLLKEANDANRLSKWTSSYIKEQLAEILQEMHTQKPDKIMQWMKEIEDLITM